jgi:excisionase family DNA binding protein
MATTERDTWLPLSKAAQRLNVHPSTLRRWADNGDVPVLLTPGGHRRFATADLDQFAQEHRVQQEAAIEEKWAGEALTQARHELVAHRDEQWLAVYDESARQRHRELGMRLLGLTMRFLADEKESERCLEEARQIGGEYGRIAQAMGQSLSAALRASIFFRDTLVETAIHLPESAHVRPATSHHLHSRINALLNTVHLAIAEVYDAEYAAGLSRA